MFHPLGFHNLAVVRFNLGVQLAKAGEVRVIKEQVGRLLHLGHVKRSVISKRVVLVKRILDPGNLIVVSAGERIETSMGLGLHFPDAIDHDIRGKKHIQPIGKVYAIFNWVFHIKMSIITPGMHPRVGSSTTCDTDRLSQFKAKATFQLGLNTRGVGLHLPAAVAGSVIGKMDKIAFHVRKITKSFIFANKFTKMRTSFFSDDTICAVATPQGMGAIATVRVSGPQAHAIVCGLFSRKGEFLNETRVEGYRAYFGQIVSYGETLDEAVVTFFKAPHSFTGEDAAEISVHGSVFIQQRLLELLVEKGARLALPGEFTRRAFVNRKFDLAQAEAVADLIASQNEASHRVAMNQLKGGFSKELQIMRSKLLEITSLIELELDFSEEDVEFADRSKLKVLLNETLSHVFQLMDSFRWGNAIKNGIPVAIVGETNTGKSTLLNALLGEDRAIVSDIAGTTRDTIEEVMNLNGTMFRFIDTAGIRETEETIEKIGIERTFRKISEADIVLGLVDATQPHEELAKAAQMILGKIDDVHQVVVLLLNKTDLCPSESADKIDLLKSLVTSTSLNHSYIQTLSAKTGNGLDQLRQTLMTIQQSRNVSQDTVLVTNVRHFEALKHASESLQAVQTGLEDGIPTDFIAQDLREALYYLGSITGEITTDEVLGSIFSRFCIGK